MLERIGGGAPEVLLGIHDRHGLAATCVSQSWSSGSIGSLALFRSCPSRYSTHEHGHMSRLSGECRVKWLGETSDRQRTGSSGTLPS